MGRITTLIAALALAALSACGGETSQVRGQNFAELEGLRNNAQFARTDTGGQQLDPEGEWDWLSSGNSAVYFDFGGDSPNQYPAIYRSLIVGDDGVTYVSHAVTVGGEKGVPSNGGTVVYEGAADLYGQPTGMPAVLGTTCVAGSCDYWQTNEARLTADFDAGSARLDISGIESRADDPLYMPDNGEITYVGRIEGTEIVSSTSPQEGRLSGSFYTASTRTREFADGNVVRNYAPSVRGSFLTFDEFPDESPRGDVAKEHHGAYSLGLSSSN